MTRSTAFFFCSKTAHRHELKKLAIKSSLRRKMLGCEHLPFKAALTQRRSLLPRAKFFSDEFFHVVKKNTKYRREAARRINELIELLLNIQSPNKRKEKKNCFIAVFFFAQKAIDATLSVLDKRDQHCIKAARKSPASHQKHIANNTAPHNNTTRKADI